MPLPVIIVTGFLGCGKTSFLRHLLPMCGEVSVKPALIINEVGDVDVDGELLADLHAEQAKLVGGCVCCTLQARLTQTIDDVLERNAFDCIIIECSGLSNPMDVVGALAAPALLRKIAVSHIICLLDSAKAEKAFKVVEIAQTQVASADILILNKADIVSDEQKESLLSLISDRSENAERFWASYGDIGEENLRKILTDEAPTHCSCCCHDHDHEHGHEHHHHHEHSHELPASFCTVAVPLPESVKRERLESALAALPETAVRAKGFANVEDEGWHILHKVFDTSSISPLSGPAPSVGPMLICIGQHLSPEEISALVRSSLN